MADPIPEGRLAVLEHRSIVNTRVMVWNRELAWLLSLPAEVASARKNWKASRDLFNAAVAKNKPLQREVAALRARCSDLEGILTPFARFGEEFKRRQEERGSYCGEYPVTQERGMLSYCVASDYENAADALAGDVAREGE